MRKLLFSCLFATIWVGLASMQGAAERQVGTRPETTLPPTEQNGCQVLLTVRELPCRCAGGFVFETSQGQLLLPTYPLPHNPQLQDGQRYRANFVITDGELVADCFELGCSAQGYPTVFKCLQPAKQ